MRRRASQERDHDHGVDALVGVRLAATLVVVCALAWLLASQVRARIPRTPAAPIRVIETTVAYLPLSSIGADDDASAPPLSVVAPAPPPDLAAPTASEASAPTQDELTALAAAAAAEKGDAISGYAAGAVEAALQRAALEWIALKSAPAPSFGMLAAFAAAHPDWPSMDWIHESEEAALYRERPGAPVVAAFFAKAPPRTPVGRLVLARMLEADHPDQAALVARGVWRDDDLTPWAESAVLKEFAVLLTPADHRYRAERLLYREQIGSALRAAERAGSDAVALASVWASAIRSPPKDAAWDALPAALKGEPGLVYLRIQGLRRANRAVEAAALLRQAGRRAPLTSTATAGGTNGG